MATVRSLVDRLQALASAAEHVEVSEAGLERFVQYCYEDNWVVTGFDWGEWAETARRLSAERTLLESVDHETLAKLLTTHIRMERFVDGHLAEIVLSGLFDDLGRRAAALAAQLKR